MQRLLLSPHDGGCVFLGRCTSNTIPNYVRSNPCRITALILFEPFRFQRLISFTNPWADPLGVGYQLSNALMAFGRGRMDWNGFRTQRTKVSYLPEAHTDFMLAVLGEEFGFVGVTLVMVLSFTMLACCIRMGHRALQHNYLRAGYLAYGISIIF